MKEEKKYLEGTKIEDLRGMKFGELTVVDFDCGRYEVDKIRKNNGEISQIRAYWICVCKCGKTISSSGSDLKGNHIKYCGLCYTFEDWCKDNNHQDYLELWDYDLNDKKPSDVSYGSNKKYWFKCEKGIHRSEQWSIRGVVTLKDNGNYATAISCRRCKSFGQYLLDTYGNLDMWSSENSYNIFDISHQTNKKVKLICRDCGIVKSIKCNNFINKGLRCGCGDGMSYPNKFMSNFLNQTSIRFEVEKQFYWSIYKRYDHYIENYSILIESHGIQHYEQTCRKGARTLEEEQYNDELKRELALSNGIKHYIELDCRKSELEWIKNSIMNSELPKLLNFKEEDIDWFECDRYATKNLAKEVCEMWSYIRSTSELSKHFNMARTTIRNYLNNGAKVGWCEYDGVEEKYLNVASKSKKVAVFKDNIFIGKFCSTMEIERKSEELFGTKFTNSSISDVGRGKRSQYKGFVFKYL